jgi:thioredoxin 1
MATIIHADDPATFEAEVLQSTVPVVVDFWAEWCGPCRMVTPELEKIADAHGSALKVVKVDVPPSPAGTASRASPPSPCSETEQLSPSVSAPSPETPSKLTSVFRRSERQSPRQGHPMGHVHDVGGDHRPAQPGTEVDS